MKICGVYTVPNYEEWTRDELIAELMKRHRNERGAGRKPKITEDVKEAVRCYRAVGMTYRAIADRMGFSVGLIYKASKA